MESVRELFVHELGDMLNAEKQILQGLEQFIAETNVPQLRQAFERHYQETEGQIERIEQVFQVLGEESEEEECKGVKGLVEEKQAFMKESPSEELLQMFNVGAAEKVEHYEISSYEGLIEMAQDMGMTQAVRLLQQNLREEQQTLKKLEGLSDKVKVENLGLNEEEMQRMQRSRSRAKSSSKKSSSSRSRSGGSSSSRKSSSKKSSSRSGGSRSGAKKSASRSR